MGAAAHRATRSARPAEVERAWYVVDATDQVLGRLATRVASILRGKHKVIFTPHVGQSMYSASPLNDSGSVMPSPSLFR